MNNRTYLDRYLAGEHEEVWRELKELGSRVCEEPLQSDAWSVCEEIVRRAHHNLSTLKARLLDLGYEFAEPDAALVEAGPEAEAEIDCFESEFGALPLIIRAWYLKLASVDFRQAQEQLRHDEVEPPKDTPDIYGLGSHPMLIVQSLNRSREDWAGMAQRMAEDALAVANMLAEVEARGEDSSEWGAEAAPLTPCLLLGSVASNCSMIAVNLPCQGVDAILEDDLCEDNFVDFLRSVFAWGGFPFWSISLRKPGFFSPFDFSPKFEKLLPILRAGLLEL